MPRTVISVDPGLSGTGWAEFVADNLVRSGCVFIPKKKADGMSLYERSLHIAGNIPRGDMLVIEHMWASPKKGFAVNGIIKTSFLSGVIAAQYREVDLVYPNVWQPRGARGMNSKEAAYAWVTTCLGADTIGRQLGAYPKHCSSHIVDAIGIGLWFKENACVL